MLDVQEDAERGATPSPERARRVSVRAIAAGKLEHAVRLALTLWPTRLVPLYVVTEYPRSGGTWLGQLIADVLGVPFPRNRVPPIRRALFHGHYLPSRRHRGLQGIFWLVRDGRDVMVSLYYHLLFPNDRNVYLARDLGYYRRHVPFRSYEAIRENLPSFIEFMFTHQRSRISQFTRYGNWATFNARWLEDGERWLGARLCRVQYERLLTAPAEEVARAIRMITGKEPDRAVVDAAVERYSFARQTGRQPGQEAGNRFLRKGIAGDWRNHFSRAAAEAFNHYAGETLIRLGYEADDTWVGRVE